MRFSKWFCCVSHQLREPNPTDPRSSVNAASHLPPKCVQSHSSSEFPRNSGGIASEAVYFPASSSGNPSTTLHSTDLLLLEINGRDSKYRASIGKSPTKTAACGGMERVRNLNHQEGGRKDGESQKEIRVQSNQSIHQSTDRSNAEILHGSIHQSTHRTNAEMLHGSIHQSTDRTNAEMLHGSINQSVDAKTDGVSLVPALEIRMNASPVSGHGSTQYSSTGFLPQLEKELCNGGRVNRSINVSPVCVCDVRSIDQSRASSHDAASLRSISRPQSLLVQECCSTSSTLPKLLSPNDLLTPEVLENPEALAALGFGYPPGYGPPYPPLTLDVVNSLACRHRCVVSPQDLEVHEMCRSPSSNTSGFCSGSFLTGADGNSKDCPSGANSVSSSEEDKTLLQQEDAEAEFSGWSTCEFPVELKDVQKLFQLGDTALRDNGSNCSDFNALRVMFSALRILYYGDLKTLIPVVRQYARDTVSDFLLKSSVAGLTADEMIAAVTEVSEDRVTGVFIPTVPPRAPKMADVELDKFLAFWMARGAVPIVCCANFEASNERATATDSNGFSWQYRVVYGVEEGRIHVMTPVASLNLKAMWECLEAPVSLAISPKVVFGDLGDARPLGDLSDLRFLDDKLNVLGQVNYFLQLRTANSADRSPDPLLQSSRFLRYGYGQRVPLVPTLDHITVPTRMCSGILLFARSDSVALCKLLKSF